MNNNHNIAYLMIDIMNKYNPGLECFLGGSCRFELDQTYSDIDLFVYVPAKDTFLKFCEGYGILYYDITDDDDDYFSSYKGEYTFCDGTFNTSLFNKELDLNIFFDRDEWIKVRTEHNKVELYLESNPNVKTLLQKLQVKNSGSDRYRVLLEEAEKASSDTNIEVTPKLQSSPNIFINYNRF